MKWWLFGISWIAMLVSACSDKVELGEDATKFHSILLKLPDTETTWDSLIVTLEDSISPTERYSVINQQRVIALCQRLKDLANKGYGSRESLPVLFNALEYFAFIPDSLVVAETISEVTNTDYGYAKFVSKYSEKPSLSESDQMEIEAFIENWKRDAGLGVNTE